MTALLHIRPAAPLDAGRVGGLLTAFAEETDWLPRIHTAAEDIAHADMMIARGWVTVAATGREITGFIARDGETVHALYVAGQSRGRSIGARLLSEAKRACPRLTLWTFQANARARAFYAREGFGEVEFTDGAANDEKLPDVRLEWRRED